MTKTWPIDCDMRMLEMIQFCIESMGHMLSEDIKAGGGCGCGEKTLSVKQLRADLKTANYILAAVSKGQVNLAVSQYVAAKKRRSKNAKR